jgi:thiamine biosynthesis lipoprotein
VGVKNPQSPAGNPALAVTVKDSSVVTSGMYERFFEQDDIRYHHILNPATGFPVWNDVQSVTIVCKSSMLADALSTSVFILGQEKGLKLLEAENAEGVIIATDNKVYPTSGMTNQLTVVSPFYQLAE